MLCARSSKLEILDNPESSGDDVRLSLDFMVFVNRRFGGSNVILDYFKKKTTSHEFTVLDLGCGSGDIPFAIVNWAKQAGKRAHVTAIDLNTHCLDYAHAHFASPDISFIKASAFDLEKLGSFDYIVSSMFFHHLSDEAIIDLFQRIARQSRKGFVINDLYRCCRNYWGAMLLALPTFKKILINDAPLSVLRAFQENDFLKYRQQSGVPFQIERKTPFRLVASYHV